MPLHDKTRDYKTQEKLSITHHASIPRWLFFMLFDDALSACTRTRARPDAECKVHMLDKIQEILFFGIIDFFSYYIIAFAFSFPVFCTWTDLHIDTYHFVLYGLCTNHF
jgi:hypothetical protein